MILVYRFEEERTEEISCFPFGDTHGRLVLKDGVTVVAKASFGIANDGGPFGEHSWSGSTL